MSAFADQELEYLQSQQLERLATVTSTGIRYRRPLTAEAAAG